MLLALLQDYVTVDIVRPDHRAQGLQGFEPPSAASSPHDLLAHIKAMPNDEPPDLFGLHPNADISKSLREMLSMCSQLRRLGEVEGVHSSAETDAEGIAAVSSAPIESSSAESDEARVAATCQELL